MRIFRYFGTYLCIYKSVNQYIFFLMFCPYNATYSKEKKKSHAKIMSLLRMDISVRSF